MCFANVNSNTWRAYVYLRFIFIGQGGVFAAMKILLGTRSVNIYLSNLLHWRARAKAAAAASLLKRSDLFVVCARCDRPRRPALAYVTAVRWRKRRYYYYYYFYYCPFGEIFYILDSVCGVVSNRPSRVTLYLVHALPGLHRSRIHINIMFHVTRSIIR